MRLFITGANGQLGTELLAMLHSGRAEIGAIPADYATAEILAVDKEQLDLTNFTALQQTLQQFKPDVMINCAAFTNVDGCEINQDTAFLVNSVVPQQLALYAEKTGCKLVQVSTDYVFAGNGAMPYQEWDACAPNSIYGKSKYLGEQYALQCGRAFVVRTAWLYGYHGHNFIKTIVKAAKAGKPLKVIKDQLGNPTNANDLAYHILKLAVTEQYGIYHCTNNGVCSWYDFACAFLQMAGIDNQPAACSTEEFYAGKEPKPANRPAYSALDNMALRNTVGDEMRSWQDALAQYMKNGLERGIFA